MKLPMRFTQVAAGLLCAPATLRGQAADGPPPVRATFAVVDTTGNRLGQVTAVQQPNGVQLEILVTGLSPGRHGLHLHLIPACEPPGFSSADGHLNPDGRQHGRHNPAGPHLGDLPNLDADARGTARAHLVLDGVTLTAGQRSIGIPGTALIIHAGEDDEQSDPAGKAGARIACAVISIAPG